MRKILEDLIFIGNVSEKYRVFGKDWYLRTLTADEQIQVTASARDYDDISKLNVIKVSTLARSITKIDDTELKDIKEKYDILSKIQQPLIDILFDKYENLEKKQEEELDKLKVEDSEEVKN